MRDGPPRPGRSGPRGRRSRDAEPRSNSVVAEKLAALKPNQAVLLGKAEVMGDFNDTLLKYEPHKTGPKGRDFTIGMCWAA